MAAETQTDLPGLDLDRLGVWLSSTVPGAGSALSATLIAGGKLISGFQQAEIEAFLSSAKAVHAPR